jgi:hypothetical protein
MSYIIGEEYHGLNPSNHKFTPREWHGRYKLDCFKMFGFKCSDCWESIRLGEGVVHHKTYKHKGGIYQAEPKEIKDKICLMCYSCHEKTHQTKSIDGITRIIPIEPYSNECVCNNCGGEYSEDTTNIDYEMCDECISTIQSINEYTF